MNGSSRSILISLKVRALTTFEQVPDCWAVIWQQLEAHTLGRIREKLAKEIAQEGQHLLIQNMTPVGTLSGDEGEKRFDELLALLRELAKGIEDGSPSHGG
jgi:hypothetical protein